MAKLRNLLLLIKTVRNWPTALLAFFFPRNKSLQLTLRSRQKIFIRERSTDIHEVIAVLSGRDYPKQYWSNLAKRPLIVDVGAHIGTFSLLAKSVYPLAKIISFEPNPKNFKLLKKNFDTNKLRSVKCFPVAVSAKTGLTSFTVSENMNENKIDKDGSLKVVSLTLNNLQMKLKKSIDLLKLDCEGSEYEILETTKDLSSIDLVVLEYHDLGGNKNSQWLKKILTKRNFKLIYHNPTPQLKSGIMIFKNQNFRRS